MNRPILALLALCAVAEPLDRLATSQFAEPVQHGYSALQVASLDALIGASAPDILAVGRHNALHKAPTPRYTEREAAALIAKIWNIPGEAR